MRYVYVALTVVLVAQLVLLLPVDSTPSRPAVASTPEIARGDSLASVDLIVSGGEVTSSTKSLFGHGCRVLVFFDSRCEYCKSIAPRWAGIDTIHLGGSAAPVSWVAVSADDSGAAQFVERHSLSRPWFRFVSREDRRSFGIRGWPKLIVVQDGVVTHGELPWTPARIDSAGTSCGASPS